LFVFGDDKMVLGSDWPFAMGTDDPYGQVKHRGKVLAGRVTTTNAERLLRRHPVP
jgi:aminocarboxymuconate-semialdehyde decarboxylase